jgi:hypothetical protein
VDASTTAILVVVAVIVVVAALFFWQQRRSRSLRERFGPEYDRAVSERGDKRRGESELLQRQKRRGELDIRSLEPAERDQFWAEWRDIQARFVDAPNESISDANVLVQRVMRARGYPVDDFEQRSADISVDHPKVVENYRAAHGISLASQQDQASTEDLRQGLVHYRSLFEELLEKDASHHEEAR